MRCLLIIALLSVAALGSPDKIRAKPRNTAIKPLRAIQLNQKEPLPVEQPPGLKAETKSGCEQQAAKKEATMFGLTNSELVMAGLTAIYVILTAVYVGISLATLRTIKREERSNADRFNKQLAAMKESGEQTDKLI